jgi:hypothetical protein
MAVAVTTVPTNWKRDCMSLVFPSRLVPTSAGASSTMEWNRTHERLKRMVEKEFDHSAWCVLLREHRRKVRFGDAVKIEEAEKDDGCGC